MPGRRGQGWSFVGGTCAPSGWGGRSTSCPASATRCRTRSSDRDLAQTAETFAAHAHAGSLLIVDVLNARCYLDGDGFRERIEGTVDTPEFKATSVSTHSLDRGARLLQRTRVWRIPGCPDIEDYAEYRLLYPEELTSAARSRRIRDQGDVRQSRVQSLRSYGYDYRRTRCRRVTRPQALRLRPQRR